MKRKSGTIFLAWLSLVLIFVLSCGRSGNRVEPSGKTEQGKAASAPSRANEKESAAGIKFRYISDPLVFVKFTEQRESAFSCLVPKGWITEGGIFYVDPNAAGGYANATGPKLNFTIKKDAAGTVMIQWLPDYYYIDTRTSPAAQMGLFPTGSNYNGMMVMPLPSARDFLLNLALRQLRPRAENMQVLEARSLPEVAAKYQQSAPVQGFRYDAAEAFVTYTENGLMFKEKLFTAIENLGQLGAGMWQNKQTVAARTPADEFDEWGRVGEIVYNSVKINPQWLAAVIQASNERANGGLRVQRYVQEVDKEILANKAKNFAEIRHDGYLNLTGQEDYVNPYTGETEIHPDGWKYHWENPNGEVVMSNNQSYDPNHDTSINRSDFKRSQVRKRNQP